MKKPKKILVINLGSTSTKVAVYEAEKTIVTDSLNHTAEELRQYRTIIDQYEFRENAILVTNSQMSGHRLPKPNAKKCQDIGYPTV